MVILKIYSLAAVLLLMFAAIKITPFGDFKKFFLLELFLIPIFIFIILN